MHVCAYVSDCVQPTRHQLRESVVFHAGADAFTLVVSMCMHQALSRHEMYNTIPFERQEGAACINVSLSSGPHTGILHGTAARKPVPSNTDQADTISRGILHGDDARLGGEILTPVHPISCLFCCVATRTFSPLARWHEQTTGLTTQRLDKGLFFRHCTKPTLPPYLELLGQDGGKHRLHGAAVLVLQLGEGMQRARLGDVLDGVVPPEAVAHPLVLVGHVGQQPRSGAMLVGRMGGCLWDK